MDQPRLVPCGSCVGCRTSRAAQWSARGFLELLSYPDGSSCFITLTYSDDSLPPGGSLVPQHLTDFFKRLRSRFGKLRYLACGEYGDQTNRPHYHAILFGWRPSDSIRYSSTVETSFELSSVWPFGLATVAPASTAAASYVAGYVTKKLSSSSYPSGLVPPFLRVSSKPALGSRWISDHYAELVHDQLYVSPGTVVPVPKHLLSLMEVDAPDVYRGIKRLRSAAAARASIDLNRPSYSSVEANFLARQRVRDIPS